MSLKAFHVVFVACSILLALFCGVWFLHDYFSGHDAMSLAASFSCFAAGVGLVCYAKSVLRKLKNISYL